MRDPLEEILGPEFSESLGDQEGLANMNRPLAGLDMVMRRSAARLAANDCGDYRKEIMRLVGEVSKLHSEMMVHRGRRDEDKMHKAALNLSRKIDETREYCDRAVENLQSERAFVEMAERVARNMSEAWKVRLNAANVLNSSEVSRVMSAIADIIVESLPRDKAQAVVKRIENEVFTSKLKEIE